MVSACGRVAFDRADADAGAIDAHPDAVPQGFCATAMFANAPASSLQDDFTTPYTSRWAPTNPGSPCIAQVGTELVATPPSSAGEFCYAYTLGDYHLTCDAIFMRVPEVTSPVLRVQTFLYIYAPADDMTLSVILEAGGLQMSTINGQPLATAPFDPVQDVWWRVAEHDGETTFDTSQDGIAWRELMRTPTPISFDRAEISIGAGTYGNVTSPGQARFRCYNVPPPCN